MAPKSHALCLDELESADGSARVGRDGAELKCVFKAKFSRPCPTKRKVATAYPTATNPQDMSTRHMSSLFTIDILSEPSFVILVVPEQCMLLWTPVCRMQQFAKPDGDTCSMWK